MTPCFISEMPGEKTKALLVGFYQKKRGRMTHHPESVDSPPGKSRTLSRSCCSNRAML